MYYIIHYTIYYIKDYTKYVVLKQKDNKIKERYEKRNNMKHPQMDVKQNLSNKKVDYQEKQ